MEPKGRYKTAAEPWIHTNAAACQLLGSSKAPIARLRCNDNDCHGLDWCSEVAMQAAWTVISSCSEWPQLQKLIPRF